MSDKALASRVPGSDVYGVLWLLTKTEGRAGGSKTTTLRLRREVRAARWMTIEDIPLERRGS